MTSALHSLTTDARFTFELKEVAGAIDGMSRAVDHKQGETVDPPSQYQTNEEDSIKTFREMTTEKKGPQSLSNTIGKNPYKSTGARVTYKATEDPSVDADSVSTKTSKNTRSSRTTKSSLTASDLTSVTNSVATLASNVSSLQRQFEQMMKVFAASQPAASNPFTTPASLHSAAPTGEPISTNTPQESPSEVPANNTTTVNSSHSEATSEGGDS